MHSMKTHSNIMFSLQYYYNYCNYERKKKKKDKTIFLPVWSEAIAALCSASFVSYQLFIPSFEIPCALKTASLATSIWSVIASYLIMKMIMMIMKIMIIWI